MPTSPITVIAFVPGTTASEINDASGNVWPTLLNSDLLKSEPLRYAAMLTAFETNARLPVGNIVSAYPLPGGDSMPCYQSLLTYLATASSFSDNTPFTFFTYNTANASLPVPSSNRLFYMVPYDWRRNNDNQSLLGFPNSGLWLSTALNKLHTTYSQIDPNYNLYIMAHSMGGLVSRFVLEAQAASKNPWLNNARGLITLSTPHEGAPLALAAILGQQINAKEPAAAVSFIKATVNNSMFPSTYELLPPPGQSFIQDGNLAYGPANAPEPLQSALSSGGFSYGNWATATAYFNQLTPQASTMPIPYSCYYGSTVDTVTGFTYANGAFTPVTTASGDAVVPQASSSFAVALASNITRTPFAGYTHGQMGGSDMATAPAAIVSALTQAGIPALAPTS
jgi:hypothetical protein